MNDSSYIPVDGGVCAPQGFVGSAVSCGIKKPTATRLDLALIYSTEPCVSAGTFTTNRVQAACVKVSREHLRKGNIRAIVANSGNANACTGAQGVEDARGECRSVAELLGLKPAEVAVCSTGVIGLPMPMMRIYPKFPELAEGLSRDKGHEVAQAVMTSDTKEKIIAIEFMVQGRPVRIGACCKGAGMINPCMATMLCFITTDAGISRDVLELCVQSGVKSSFNCITIDGDMSTNDTVLVMANGASGVKLESPEDIYAFQQALAHVMLELAKHIVQDGERVTKFVTVHVTGGRTEDEAKKAAEAAQRAAEEERRRAAEQARREREEAARRAQEEAQQKAREEAERRYAEQQKRWQQDPWQQTHTGGPAQGQYTSQRTAGAAQAQYTSQRTGSAQPNAQNAGQQRTYSPADETMRRQAAESVERQKLSVFSYLGPFWLIPAITQKDDPFMKYHTEQGLGLIIFGILTSLLGNLWGWVCTVGGITQPTTVH